LYNRRIYRRTWRIDIFLILVCYSAIVLLIGAIISFLSRKVPSQFNETKILTISIYNIGFLGIVIIPVFIVVNEYNPFIAWILRTLSILYAFTATMLLQFVPKIIGIFIIDKGRNVKLFKSALGPLNHSFTPSQSKLNVTPFLKQNWHTFLMNMNC